MEGKLGSLSIKLLIDTGASLSIISKGIFNQLIGEHNLDPMTRPVMTANDEPLTVYGKTKVSICIGRNTYQVPVVVAEMNSDGILGLDFMLSNDCILDIARLKMQMQTDVIQLNKEGHFGCYRIAMAENINLPARTEMVVNCNVCLPKGTTMPDGDGLIEPDEGFLSSERGLVGRVLVSNDKMVPVRIMNVSNEVKVVRAGTVIAKLTPVSEVLSKPATSASVKEAKELPLILQDLYNRACEGLDVKQRKHVRKFLIRHSEIFAKDDRDFGRTDLVKHNINTGSKPPIRQPLRRTPVHLQDTVNEHIGDMLKRDVIEPSSSPWASGIVLAKKKDGTTRFCIDYRKLNDATIKDAYPLPRIDDTLDHLAGSCMFSTLDLSSGYWQVEMEPEDRPKTAFITKRGLYQFKEMPFGLCNAPATFERLMETVLSGLQWEMCLVYLDDIIVLGKSFEDMMQNLETVFNSRSEIEGKEM